MMEGVRRSTFSIDNGPFGWTLTTPVDPKSLIDFAYVIPCASFADAFLKTVAWKQARAKGVLAETIFETMTR